MQARVCREFRKTQTSWLVPVLRGTSKAVEGSVGVCLYRAQRWRAGPLLCLGFPHLLSPQIL